MRGFIEGSWRPAIQPLSASRSFDLRELAFLAGATERAGASFARRRAFRSWLNEVPSEVECRRANALTGVQRVYPRRIASTRFIELNLIRNTFFFHSVSPFHATNGSSARARSRHRHSSARAPQRNSFTTGSILRHPPVTGLTGGRRFFNRGASEKRRGAPERFFLVIFGNRPIPGFERLNAAPEFQNCLHAR
jgi:hypothetical protein